jgi:hypothetical protein
VGVAVVGAVRWGSEAIMVVADFGRWALKSTGRIRFFLLSSTYFLLEGPVLRIERRVPCHNFPKHFADTAKGYCIGVPLSLPLRQGWGTGSGKKL